jgi:glycosyltransferase involved in cell wall biosynthesis
MHIGIDAHAIGARLGGNETYIKNLIETLARSDSTNRYTLYFVNREAATEWRGRFERFTVRLLPPPTPIIRVPVALELELRRRPVDVLHVQYTAPTFCPVPVVATIHDLAFEHLPETFTRRGRAQLRFTVRRTARRAARIATVSEFSRQDIIRTYGIAPEKVAVTYNGISPIYRTEPESADEAAELRNRYRIRGQYILAVGSVQPRKNLIRLIRAYDILRLRNPDLQTQLVLVGRHLWLFREVVREAARHARADDIVMTGYVPEKDLPVLYRNAMAFVYPSLFEGFGLPPVEAMACGTPVITSDLSSLPEIVGSAALLVNPYDEGEIAGAIDRLLTDTALRRRLAVDGAARAKAFTWESTANKTLALYHQSCEWQRE